MTSKKQINIRWWHCAMLLVLLLTMGLFASAAFAGKPYGNNSGAQASPNTIDAFLFLQPNTTDRLGTCPAPANGGVTTVGCTFALDMMLNSGSNTAPDGLTAHQSYITFTSQLMSVTRYTDPAVTCVATNTISTDPTVFDAVLQNEVCNNQSGGCVFRGLFAGSGSIAYASGGLANCPSGCPDPDQPPAQGQNPFRVGSIPICANAAGVVTIHWQFTDHACGAPYPPSPAARDTEMITAFGNIVGNCALYPDYHFTVSGAATNTPTATNTTQPPTATRTNTATSTATAIPPTLTATRTPVPPTATRTNTALPPTITRTNTRVPPTATRTNTVAPPTRTNTTVPPTRTSTVAPPTLTSTPCNDCRQLTIKLVGLTCATGGLAYDVQIKNGASCTQTRSYSVQVQYKLHGGLWTAGTIVTGTQDFPADVSHVVGGFQCGVDYPAAAEMERVEFSFGGSDPNCRPSKKSSVVQCACGSAPIRGSFHDVPEGSPFSDGVMALVYARAITGYADGTFRPGNIATRAQAAKVVVLAFGLPLQADGGRTTNDQTHLPFSDVSGDSIYFAYIKTAYGHGLISGFGDGTFRPNDGVTREEVARMVVQAAGIPLLNPAKPSFSDVPPGSRYYTYIETATASGILCGYSDGTFKPSLPATRGQLCKITYLAASRPGN